MKFNKPPALKKGDSIGIFTPSWPANCILHEKYLLGVDALRGMGFEVTEGTLTRKFTGQGYRAGSIRERAAEFNELYTNPDVKCLISTIGGECSGSMIPYLDYDFIKKHPKIVCGYSDVTALHLALNTLGNLTTFYGPSVVSSFGESPSVPEYTLASWLMQMGMKALQPPFSIIAPAHYSNEFIDARKSGWKQQHRTFKINAGWKIVKSGKVKGPVRALNLSTLCSLAGTPLWPQLQGNILLLEQMNTSFALEERLLNQLKLIGVFDLIAGLIISKPEKMDRNNAPFTYEELLLELIGSSASFPIIINFDCGHTVPMLTIPQGVLIEMDASDKHRVPTVVQYELGVLK